MVNRPLCRFCACKGDVVITMDADYRIVGRNSELHKMVTEDGLMTSGWKKKRHDNAVTKNLPPLPYNGPTVNSGIKLHDMNCGCVS